MRYCGEPEPELTTPPDTREALREALPGALLSVAMPALRSGDLFEALGDKTLDSLTVGDFKALSSPSMAVPADSTEALRDLLLALGTSEMRGISSSAMSPPLPGCKASLSPAQKVG